MHNQLELIVAERTENHSRLLLATKEGSEIEAISGMVRGPFCEFAKTLTADFSLKSSSHAGAVESLVVEPCYWTPLMPFWYDLRLHLRMRDGTEREEVLPVGIRRFYCEGRNLRLESKRIVLRGLRYDSPTEGDLRRARECETALILSNPSKELCLSASRLGVPLVVDLSSDSNADQLLERLEWTAAVMLVLVSEQQLADGVIDFQRPRRFFVAGIVNSDSPEPNSDGDAFAVILTDDERPAAWLSTCDKPVLAIRQGSKGDITTARASCDRLQAALAPEFDLAGYFV